MSTDTPQSMVSPTHSEFLSPTLLRPQSTKPRMRYRSRSEAPHHVQVCCQRTPTSAFRWLCSSAFSPPRVSTSAARCLGPGSPSSTPTRTRAARRRSRTSHTGSQNTPTPLRTRRSMTRANTAPPPHSLSVSATSRSAPSTPVPIVPSALGVTPS